MLAPRLKLALIAVTLCAVAAVAGVWLAARENAGPSSRLQLTNGWAGAQRPSGQPVPDFTLRDQDAQTVRAADLRGKPVVFAFIYSTCRDTCPAQVQTIRNALDRLDDPDARVIGISVDPVNDNPKRASSFLLKQQMTGRMQFLLGTRAQLEPVWKAFGIAPQTTGRDHSSYTVIVDAQGRQRISFPATELTPRGLASDLAKF